MVKAVYACGVCGFVYSTKKQAGRCEAFCTKNGACSLSITSRAFGRPRKPTFRR